MNILTLYTILGANPDIDFQIVKTDNDKGSSEFLYTDPNIDPELHLHLSFYTNRYGKTVISLLNVIRRIDNIIYTMNTPSWANWKPDWPVTQELVFGFPSPSNPMDVIHGWTKLHLIAYGDLFRDLVDSTSHDRYKDHEKNKLKDAHELFERRLEIAKINTVYNFVTDITVGCSWAELISSTKYMIANNVVYKLPAMLKNLSRPNVEKMINAGSSPVDWEQPVRLLYPEMFNIAIVAKPKRIVKKKEEKVS
ncbi:MAG TPA: hypothetical protein VK190_02575 [Pseudoneobacillus sp.]|nr:hypothetical protein [Pseudoneobacillus sp.]